MSLDEEEEIRKRFHNLIENLPKLAKSVEIPMGDKYMAQVYLCALIGGRLNPENYDKAFELINKYPVIR
ncbi:MAG: hypothetical protein ABIH28_01830 [archaeon]